jgi:hypothetical protein
MSEACPLDGSLTIILDRWSLDILTRSSDPLTGHVTIFDEISRWLDFEFSTKDHGEAPLQSTCPRQFIRNWPLLRLSADGYRIMRDKPWPLCSRVWYPLRRWPHAKHLPIGVDLFYLNLNGIYSWSQPFQKSHDQEQICYSNIFIASTFCCHFSTILKY